MSNARSKHDARSKFGLRSKLNSSVLVTVVALLIGAAGAAPAVLIDPGVGITGSVSARFVGVQAFVPGEAVVLQNVVYSPAATTLAQEMHDLRLEVRCLRRVMRAVAAGSAVLNPNFPLIRCTIYVP